MHAETEEIVLVKCNKININIYLQDNSLMILRINIKGDKNLILGMYTTCENIPINTALEIDGQYGTLSKLKSNKTKYTQE